MMNSRIALITAVTAAAFLVIASGCAVQRDQQTMGSYVDDTGITTLVKSRMIENKQVDGTSIHVETLKGTVMLSGFAKSATEKSTAESIARGVNGVVAVKNEITVRP